MERIRFFFLRGSFGSFGALAPSEFPTQQSSGRELRLKHWCKDVRIWNSKNVLEILFLLQIKHPKPLIFLALMCESSFFFDIEGYTYALETLEHGGCGCRVF